MSPKSVVVTGSNRGLGFGLVQQFLKDPNVQHVIATARDVDKATVSFFEFIYTLSVAEIIVICIRFVFLIFVYGKNFPTTCIGLRHS